jgi:IS30 family transposase
MPNFQRVRPSDIAYKSYNAAKFLRRPSRKPVEDPPYALGRIKGDIFIIRPTPLNNRPYGLILIDRKTRFRILRLLKSKDEAVLKAKFAIESLYNTYKRYPAHFHYDGGTEIRRLLPYLIEKGIKFTESSPYAHN